MLAATAGHCCGLRVHICWLASCVSRVMLCLTRILLLQKLLCQVLASSVLGSISKLWRGSNPALATGVCPQACSIGQQRPL